jgi:hypothetical protein
MASQPNAVQIRVSLDDVEPEVWRRIIVPADWTLTELHLTIQAAFNWHSYHLHEFHIGDLRYGDHAGDPDDDLFGVLDESKVRLRDFAPENRRISYVYDFGDDWVHSVKIEAWLFLDPAPKLASCSEGGAATPPEDVGGAPGYQYFLEVMRSPKHPEHKEIRRWYGGSFDPDWFDLALVNKDVKNALKPDVRRRPHQPKPKA